ncbi:MAG: hypothetical protein Q4C36_10335, partial [Coriobacteriia bacterium]|nr:hypothetical protein [Coriobacteriia bacterium]
MPQQHVRRPSELAGRMSANAASVLNPTQEPTGEMDESVHKSATLISACVLLSRITGFFRTWAMAFAMGS